MTAKKTQNAAVQNPADSRRSAQEAVEKASRLVSRARIAILLRHPYLASALLSFPVRAAVSVYCPTMATDGYRIYFCPEFVLGISEMQLQGVLIHELLHILFEHPSRRKGREGYLWNIACDYAVNLVVTDFGFCLPEAGLLDRRFCGKSAEEIYRLLSEASPRELKQFLGGALAGALETARKNGGFEAGAGAPDILPSDVLCGEKIRATMLEAAPGGSDDTPDVERQRQIVHAAMVSLSDAVKGQGIVSANLDRQASEALKPQVDWRALLQNFMFDTMKTDFSLFPPNKKHLARGFYLPSAGTPAPCRVIFAVDTSGSMTPRDLSAALTEIASFRESFPSRFTLIECDSVIHRVVEYEEFEPLPDVKDIRLTGGGGTDFRPVFDYVKENVGETALLIYVTDGYGTFPGKATLPVVWLVTEGGADDFPDFGTVLHLTYSD